MKTTQNTPFTDLDPLTNANTPTCIGRYFIANHWTKDKDVLDAACGYGYGSHMLAGLGARSVTGIDIDPIIDELARFNTEKLKFQKADIFNLTDYFGPHSFDTVVSIETMEHLPKEKMGEYLTGLRYVAKNTIIITTPIRFVKDFVWDGGTHLYEYNHQEMTEFLKKYFADHGWKVGVYGLRELRSPAGQLFTELCPLASEESPKLFFALIERESA